VKRARVPARDRMRHGGRFLGEGDVVAVCNAVNAFLMSCAALPSPVRGAFAAALRHAFNAPQGQAALLTPRTVDPAPARCSAPDARTVAAHRGARLAQASESNAATLPTLHNVRWMIPTPAPVAVPTPRPDATMYAPDSVPCERPGCSIAADVQWHNGAMVCGVCRFADTLPTPRPFVGSIAPRTTISARTLVVSALADVRTLTAPRKLFTPRRIAAAIAVSSAVSAMMTLLGVG